MKKSTLIACAFSLFTAGIFSQPVTLDSTFGKDGEVATTFSYNAEPRMVIVQNDGKILVLTRYLNVLCRYLSDGKVDHSFGTNGIVNISVDYSATAMVLLSDGKILITGWSLSTPSGIFLEKYRTNGDKEISFGDSGRIFTPTGPNISVESVAVYEGGKIVVAGGYLDLNHQGRGWDILLARYHFNGKIDSSFGKNGIVLTDMNGDEYSTSVAIAPTGKIILLGISNKGIVLVSYKTNGQIDSSFGNNGIALNEINSNQSQSIQPSSVKINSHHKIFYWYRLVNFQTDQYKQVALVKYSQYGVIDSLFGKNGVIKDSLFDFEIMNNGRILTCAIADIYGRDSNIILKRYTQIGTHDKSFGENGRVSINMGRLVSTVQTALQEDGKIVTASSTGSEGLRLMIARFKYQDSLSAYNNAELQKQNKNETKIARVYISPNPVKDFLQINGLKNADLLKTFIYDVNGKMLLQQTTSGNSNTINAANLSSGAYLIRIDDGKKITVLKFIKE